MVTKKFEPSTEPSLSFFTRPVSFKALRPSQLVISLSSASCICQNTRVRHECMTSLLLAVLAIVLLTDTSPMSVYGSRRFTLAT